MAARGDPPRYRLPELLLAAAGVAGAVLDLGADVWLAVGYARAGHRGWAALVLALLAAASLAAHACSWLWYGTDPPALAPALPRSSLALLHLLQLGYMYRCLRALKMGWKLCWAQAASEEEQSHMAFLSHDISMLRLFETFLENTPQLTLLLYVILRTNKAEPSQGVGICTAVLCVTWSLLDYHQSLRSFLRDKYELSLCSSFIYFLWNLFLICPRILAVALFALLWPYGVAVHFPLVWLAMFFWVNMQRTDFMGSPGSEQLYRAIVAVILYFSWFNVAKGRTLYRSIIYHGFILVDSILLAVSWLWCCSPSDEYLYLIPVVSAALPCYVLGLVLRLTYYKWLHPNVRAQQQGEHDEVDISARTEGLDFRFGSAPAVVNRRMQWLAQTHFAVSLQGEQSLLNGSAVADTAV
ncbi:XK-related protein 8 [Rhea pennata]|uniref:XK-related protein 8 n=1 Tax=Rhea pennata TaxID=8795 RepID=UPI002E27129B